jgi:hypothetical protein
VTCGTGPASQQRRAPVSPHVLRFQTRSRCGRALASPCDPYHQACLSAEEGSSVATCPAAPDPLMVREGSGVTTCPVAPGPPFGWKGLRCHHVSCGSRPASGMALASPRAACLSTSEACPWVPKVSDIRLIMTTPGMRSRQRIKCVQDKPYTAYE